MKKILNFTLAALALVAVALTLSLPPAHAADLLLKGNGFQLQPPTRGMPASLTNNVANPGFPALFRVTTQFGTQHTLIGTNGGIAFVKLGTNNVGWTGIVTQFNGTVSYYFINGILCLTNNSPSTNFLGQTIP